MKKITIAAAIAVSALASPVLAQESGDFSGVKATAIAGYDNTDFGIAGVGSADNADGFLYGASLGYDLQSNNIVYGVEAEITESTADISGGGASVDASRDLYAGARVGFVAGDKALIYAKAGYTNARYTGAGAGFGAVAGNADGVRVGAGVEFKLSDKVFARGEYRYSNYEAGVSRNQGIVGLGVKF
ncbi:porin family protein [Parasphingorhabdus sp.]|uniref:outer membrane protein n=1 Tax=Parasphingorhabdus sp. TaxID=2709688 RepID=UPI0032EF494C